MKRNVMDNSINEYKKDRKTLRYTLVKTLFRVFESQYFEEKELEKEIVNYLEKGKQEIISKLVEDKKEKIFKENKSLFGKLVCQEIRIGEDIEKYLEEKLSSSYDEISSRITEPIIKTETIQADFNGEGIGCGVGFSGSNGGPIGHLEKITKAGYFRRN